MNGINTEYIQGYANSITGIINGILVPLLIAVAFIVFLWGIYKYFIKGADSDKERETGRVFTLYGVIGFVIIFSVWGIVQIFMSTLNLKATSAPPPPTIGTGSYAPAGSGSPSASNPTASNSGSGSFTSWLFGNGNTNPAGSGGGSGGGFFTTVGNWFSNSGTGSPGGANPGTVSADCSSGDGTQGAVCCNSDYCAAGLVCDAAPGHCAYPSAESTYDPNAAVYQQDSDAGAGSTDYYSDY